MTLVCTRTGVVRCPAFATLVDALAEVALLRREVARGRNEIEMPALPA
ncbi:MAG: hypothetical protein ABWY08_10265 [Comamonas sp.]